LKTFDTAILESSPLISSHRLVLYRSARKQHQPTMESPDRMPPLVVSSVAIVGIIWVLMVLGIRLYLRCKLNGPIGNDDYAAILATSLGIAQSALVLASVNSGLGRQHSTVRTDLVDEDRIAKASLSLCLSVDRTQRNKTHSQIHETD
jgi:hypothetical protein